MSHSLSTNTQAILLLTAPLISGRGGSPADLLKPSEYKRLEGLLSARNREPADLLAPDAGEFIEACQQFVSRDRLLGLLNRGFLLSQAVERWQARAIWVVSRLDEAYPTRLKVRLKGDAPPVLYGCGPIALLDTGGLAVVGSRDANETLVEYTESIGRLAAKGKRTLISGGARGIDQAAMRSALEAGGKVAGVLADSLERAALNREHRIPIMDERLVLVSPYDPSAGFHVGNAMQRNKLIYALADAALVVNSDHEKGGTWAGAVEQLDKLHFVPVYVRSDGETTPGLEALRGKGAALWPKPDSAEILDAVLAGPTPGPSPNQEQLSFTTAMEPSTEYPRQSEPAAAGAPAAPSAPASPSPADESFAKLRSLLAAMDTPKTPATIATELRISKGQARDWLQRLVDEGVVEKLLRPVRYRSTRASGRLF